MKPYLPYLRLVPVVAASVLVLGAAASSFGDYMSETEFNSVASGSAVTGIPGWSMSNGATSVPVNTASNYEGAGGNGIDINTTLGTVSRTLTGSEIVTDPNASFQFKVYFPSAEHRYETPYFWVQGQGATGGNYGVGIRFNDTSDHSATPAGTPGGSIGYINGAAFNSGLAPAGGLPNSGWATQTWYTVEIDDVGTSPTLSMWTTNSPSTTVLDHVPIGSFGSGDTFKQIDTIAIRETSTARDMAVDDIIVGTIPSVPEPASLGLLGLGGLALIRRRRS